MPDAVEEVVGWLRGHLPDGWVQAVDDGDEAAFSRVRKQLDDAAFIKAIGESAPGEGVSFAGIDEALMHDGVDLRLFGKPESFVSRRMGVAFSTGPDVETARARARDAAGRVRPVSAT